MNNNPQQQGSPYADEAVHAPMRYWAFLSYSHTDRALAARLHHELETYRVPEDVAGRSSRDGTVPPRIRPVFRDRDELEAAAHLSDMIRDAVSTSRYMIVICSPRSARSRHVNEEIRLFKALGRGDRVLSLIVDGEPCTDDDPRHCFPKALTRRINTAGELTDDVVEPIAADARRHGDGWNEAVLKITAGLLNVRLDDLRRRESRRKRSVMRRRALIVLSALVISMLGGVLASDAGLNLPMSATVRRGLDSRGLSLFRRPHPAGAVVSSAASQRLQLSRVLLSNQAPNGMFWQVISVPAQMQSDSWLSSQVVTALTKDPGADARSARAIVKWADAIVSPPFLRDYAGGPSVWSEPNTSPRGHPVLWAVSGAAAAYRREALFSGTERARLLECLSRLEPAMLRLRTDTAGGWNMFPNMADRGMEDTYSTCLALNALQELRQSGLPFDGGVSQRDEQIRATAGWLVQCFRPDVDPPGWRRFATDGDPDGFDGLTLQAYCAVMRAQEEGFVLLPDDMITAMTRHLIACGERRASFAVVSGEFTITVVEDGRPTTHKEAVTFLWHPWAIEACVRWLRWNDSTHQAAPADVEAIRRTLGYLIIDLRQANQAAYFRQGGLAFHAAEYLMALSTVDSVPPDR